MERRGPLRVMMAVGLLSGLAASAPGYPLDLWDAYQLALRNDPGFREQVNLFEARRQRVPQARADLLPQASFDASHGRAYLEVGAEPDSVQQGSGKRRAADDKLSFPATRYEPNSVPRADDYSHSRAALTLRQTVYDRSTWLSLGRAKSRSGEARLRLDNARRSLVLELARAYFDYLGALDALETARLQKRAVARQLRLTERRYEKELGTLTDVHESRARMALATIDIINAENDMAAARHRLAKLIDSPVTDVAQLPESFEPPSLQPSGISTWVRAALDNAVGVRLARQRLKTASLDLKTEKSDRWPTLSLVGESAYEYETWSSVSSGQDRFRNEISLQLEMPLFSGFAIQSSVREAQFRRFAAEQGLRNVTAEVTRDVRTAYDSVQASRRRIDTFRKVYEQSLAALDLRKKGYLEGLSSNLDVLDAFRDAYRAKRQWLQSRYRYFVGLLFLYSLAKDVDGSIMRRIDGYFSKEAN